MAKTYLSLQPSEGVVVQAAASIYAAYITNGRVNDGTENEWLRRSIREAIQIAKTTEEHIQCKDELS